MQTLQSARKEWIGYVLIAVMVACLTGYAVWLNQIFYQYQGPFYDSLSYYNLVNRLVRYEQLGDFNAISRIAIFHSTVVLPWIQILILAPLFKDPPRWIGVLSNSIWLLILALSLFRYFKATKKLDLLLSIAFTIPFICAPFIFRRNGGLSDFRMDLLQYFLLSTTSVWCLTAIKSAKYRDWILFGIAAGFTCLVRATTPVYLILIYFPVLAVYTFIHRAALKDTLKRVSVAAVAAVLTSGWYYIANYDYLKFYYTVWNIDANAHLRIKKSIMHALFVYNDIGLAWVLFALAAALCGIVLFSKTQKLRLASLDWSALWMGLAPCGFLVVFGAGLNEWVSLPSVFILMFLLLPVDGLQRCRSGISVAFVATALAIALGLALPQPQSFREEKPWISSRRSGLDKIQTAIETDMLQSGSKSAKYTCTFADAVNNRALENCWMFDKGYKLDPNTMTLKKDSLELFTDESLNYPAPTDWRSAPGSTDDEKVEEFVHTCLAQDYLIVPTLYSAKRLSVDQSAILNLHILKIRELILNSGSVSAISGPIYCTPNEIVTVYKVHPRVASPGSSSQL